MVISTKETSFGFKLLVIYFGLILFEPQQFFPLLKQIRITYLFGIIVLCYSIFNTSYDLRRSLFQSKLVKLILVFAALNFLSLLLSDYPVTNQGDELIKTLALFIIVVLNIKDITDLSRFCNVLIIYFTINMVVTIYFYHIGKLPTRMIPYFGGLGASGSNEFSATIVQMLAFPVIMMRYPPFSLNRGFLFFSVMTFLYCFTRTGSRSGFLGASCVFVLLIFFRHLSGRYLVYGCLLILILFLKTPSSYFQRMDTMTEQNTISEDYNVSSRIDTYKKALEIMKKHPFFGVGTGNYMAHERSQFGDEKKIFVVHNSFLQIAAEAGIIAMVIFGGIIYTSLKSLFKSKKILEQNNEPLFLIDALIIGIIGYSITALWLPISFSRLLYTYLALSVMLSIITNKYTQLTIAAPKQAQI